MSTSGIYRLGSTFNDIAEEALDILQLGEDGETLDGDMVERCRKTANFMLKAWAGQGIHLWTQTEGTLFLIPGQSVYDFATSNIANVWNETTLSADEALGQATLSCTSTENIAVDDVVGVLLDANELFWSSVSSTSATTITINDALPSAASSGAQVRSYAPASFIPVNRITDVRRRESNNYEIPINFESREDYFNLPDKTSRGEPVQSYFSRQETSGKLYIWPPPSTAKTAINFTYERPMQIINIVSETVDIPEYWYEALIYNLASRLIPKFGSTVARAQIVDMKAREALDLALEFDSETYPIRMVMRHA
jgi:hypothetical protein